MEATTPDARSKKFNDCKTAYLSMEKYTGVTQVKDKKEIPEGQMQVEGVDLPKLHQGSYIMGPTDLPCLIYKVHNLDPNAFPMFRLLETVRHPYIIRHLTFYEESREPRTVLSWVDCLLWNLLTTDKACTRFFQSTNRGTSIGSEFKTIIVNICSGLEHLFKLQLYPPKIGVYDLYACKDGPNNYRVQLLILKVDKLRTKSEQRTRMTALWTQVRSIIEAFRNGACREKLSKVDNRFISYIGSDVTTLAQYPLSWSYDQKGRYLMSIISADESIVDTKLQGSGLKWPKELKRDGTLDLPKLLTALIDHDKTRTCPYEYNDAEPYDYVMLCRTVYTHFPDLSKKVPKLADMCKTRQDFLERMEKWEPLIWCILYDAIGLMRSLPSSTSGKSNC